MTRELWFTGAALLSCLSLSASLYAQSAANLAEQMKSAKDEKTVIKLRDDLARMGKEGAAALESVVLADSAAAANVRVSAALALEKMAEDSSGAFGTSELDRHTADKNPGVRYLAFKGLLSPATRYPKASALTAEALKDPSAPIRLMAIRSLAEPKPLAEVIVNPKEEREVKEQAEEVFKTLTGSSFGLALAVKRDPTNPKGVVADPDKEKAVIAKYEEWLKKNR